MVREGRVNEWYLHSFGISKVSIYLPDVVGFALDLVPAQVHVVVGVLRAQPPALGGHLLPLRIHRRLAGHTVASRPRGPPRSCNTHKHKQSVIQRTQHTHLKLTANTNSWETWDWVATHDVCYDLWMLH